MESSDTSQQEKQGTLQALKWKFIGAGFEAIGAQRAPGTRKSWRSWCHMCASCRLIATGEITCTQGSGNELDFVLVSRSIESAVTLTADWQVPWKPHAALRLTIVGAGVVQPQWRLQHFAKLTGDVSDQFWPQVG
ncbi:unnamed protein product [Symbiodinium sp. CCMP2456]|nr:unnamed protein product [Symbiodinium sp. CCMP2456]